MQLLRAAPPVDPMILKFDPLTRFIVMSKIVMSKIVTTNPDRQIGKIVNGMVSYTHHSHPEEDCRSIDLSLQLPSNLGSLPIRWKLLNPLKSMNIKRIELAPNPFKIITSIPTRAKGNSVIENDQLR